VIVSGAVGWESFQEILAGPLRRDDYIVRVSPGFYGTLGTGLTVTNTGFVPLVTISETRLSGLEKIVKYALDYVLGGLGCILAAPLMAAIALGLKWSAPAEPVLVHPAIVGLSKKPLAMLKFRARPGVRGLEYALLASGLDKLPQFFNVLLGEMSLVGPRPLRAPADDCGADGEVLSEGLNLHTVKPGIIGPWTTDAGWLVGDERQDELHYVRNWTVWLDFQLMFQTLARWLRSGPRRSYLER
jgi:lipopolysaccharide/colanic/teichoic acid biosynthesis glycosyltransferase